MLRFLFVYFVLFYVLAPETTAWDWLVSWVAAHVLGIQLKIADEMSGSGDRTSDWVRLFCVFVLAVFTTLLWCIVVRRNRGDERVHAALRIGMRYMLATTMLGYGFAKLFPFQFRALGPWHLMQAYGESSPMGLLWRFMGYSRAYAMFSGFAEVLGGLLLLSRRTTTLGALVLIGVMANVVMLNFCYDVPVKILSSHLLLLAVLLVLPDARRLADMLVLHRPTTPVSLRPPFSTPRRRLMWMVAKSLVVTSLIGGTLFTNVAAWYEMRSGGFEPDVFEVDTFAHDGEVLPPLVTDTVRWRRLLVAPEGFVTVMKMNGSKLSYRFERSDDGVTLIFTPLEGHGGGILVETILDEEHRTYAGTLNDAALELHATRVHASDFPLMTRGFHWVTEVPFNR